MAQKFPRNIQIYPNEDYNFSGRCGSTLMATFRYYFSLPVHPSFEYLVTNYVDSYEFRYAENKVRLHKFAHTLFQTWNVEDVVNKIEEGIKQYRLVGIGFVDSSNIKDHALCIFNDNGNIFRIESYSYFYPTRIKEFQNWKDEIKNFLFGSRSWNDLFEVNLPNLDMGYSVLLFIPKASRIPI